MDNPCHRLRGGSWFFDAKSDKTMSRLFHVVQNVVQLRRQDVDVFAVDWRDKSAIQGQDDPFDNLIASMFFFFQLVAAFLQAIKLRDHLEEFLRRPIKHGRRFVEHIEELFLARNQTEAHPPFLPWQDDGWDTDFIRTFRSVPRQSNERRGLSPPKKTAGINPAARPLLLNRWHLRHGEVGSEHQAVPADIHLAAEQAYGQGIAFVRGDVE